MLGPQAIDLADVAGGDEGMDTAGADEFHQTFVDSRAGQFTDVCVDMTGVLAMVTVLLIIYSGWQVHHEKKLEKERQKAEEIRNRRRRAV